jgi:hypothetical protein
MSRAVFKVKVQPEYSLRLYTAEKEIIGQSPRTHARQASYALLNAATEMVESGGWAKAMAPNAIPEPNANLIARHSARLGGAEPGGHVHPCTPRVLTR